MEHEDFVINVTDVRRVEKKDTTRIKFQVQVIGRSNAGQESSYDVQEMIDQLDALEDRVPRLDKVLALGQYLGEILVPQGRIRDSLLASLAAHKNRPDSRLRIILFLEGVTKNVPWEFMVFHTEPGEPTSNQILGLMSQVSIVRRLEHTIPVLAETKPATRPTQMVMALANPRSHDLDPLEVEKERALIKKALKGSKGVKVKYVPRATADTLLGGLEQVHLFHFAGHGTFDEKSTAGAASGEGALVLEDGKRKRKDLPAEQVAARLVEAGVRVAVLGACLTAKHDDTNMWSGTAANLINGGLGAVVGMQYAVLDTSATAFAKAFYEALALGFPVDQAVTKGRMAIFKEQDYAGFGTPVLYMGDGDGIVFPRLTNDAALKQARDKVQVVANVSADIVEDEVKGIEVETIRGAEAEVTVKALTVNTKGKVVGLDAIDILDSSIDVSLSVGEVEEDAEAIALEADHLSAGTDVNVNANATTIKGKFVGVKSKTIG